MALSLVRDKEVSSVASLETTAIAIQEKLDASIGQMAKAKTVVNAKEIIEVDG